MNYLFLSRLGYLLATSVLLIASASVYAMDIASGYFSRDGNNLSPSKASNHNIYIKIYENQWVGMLYVPYPYASSVKAGTIAEVFDIAKAKTSSSAYLRGKFDRLDELATIQIEKFGYLEDQLVFECGSLAPCTIKLYDDYLELVKPGMINEHIIRYNHVSVTEQ